MRENSFTSLERVLCTLGHKEPDRVPFFLLLTMHGAKELGVSIKEYFSKADNVVEGQLKMRRKYGHDCIYPFFYAPLEVEAWGAEVVYSEDGPPNSGMPVIGKAEDIERLESPNVLTASPTLKVLKAIEMLKAEVKDDAPIIGVVMSPFSLPVMQLGFDRYLELIYEKRPLFDHLMQVNEEFCVSWANAQIEAGATAICYFDPVSSTTIIPKELYADTGLMVAKRTLARINGPTATHLASGKGLPIVDEIASTGTAVIGTSVLDDLADMKKACSGKITILGNLNGVEMRRWPVDEVEAIVKAAIAKAGCGGGFILSDNHGEIPFQVPDEVLMAISDAVRKWGRYPLDWVVKHDG